jgi:hypothetical protein
MFESGYVMFVLDVTVLTKVCDNVVLIYYIIRIVITLKYNKRRLLYIHYFYVIAKQKLVTKQRSNSTLRLFVLKASPYFL